MKHFLLIRFTAILLWFPGALPLPAQPQPQSTGYPDIDIYYSQLEESTFEERMARRRYLCETIPIDTILAAYPLKGLTEHDETISTLDYFTYLPLTLQERPAFIEELYAKVRRGYKSRPMELLADFVKGLYMGDDSLSYESKMEWFERVIRKARKAGDSNMEAIVLRNMWSISFYGQRYVRTFAYRQRLEETLDRVDHSYRYKAYDYLNIGMAYYMFKNYDRAMPFFRKALSHRKTSAVHNPDVAPKAWNYLAVYHQTNNNLDSAAYYHRAILSSEEARRGEPAHLAIAISNLGRIEMENGDYDAAIAMLKAGLDYKKEDLDISFRSGIRISLGRCYLEKGEMKAAWEQITNARNMMDKQIDPGRQRRLKDLYTLESNYYARSEEYDLAQTYQDSALMASSRYEQLTGQHFIVLGEQQLQETELQLKTQQIARQRNIIFAVLIILTAVCGALFAILRLYRKKQAAYRNLVEKNRQWAESEQLDKATVSPKRLPSQKEEELIGHIHEMMVDRQIYRDHTLTLEMLAQMLNVNRESVSRTINLTTGKNFARFLNEYRIKEAVRFLSVARNRRINFDDLAEQIGFNNRTTFHRAFKQITGLPPNEFKNKG